MKSFFEEYGFVMLAAVVVIALIAMTSPVGMAVQKNMTDLIDDFSDKVAIDLDSVTGD